jgi:hypothetical protein
MESVWLIEEETGTGFADRGILELTCALVVLMVNWGTLNISRVFLKM